MQIVIVYRAVPCVHFAHSCAMSKPELTIMTFYHQHIIAFNILFFYLMLNFMYVLHSPCSFMVCAQWNLLVLTVKQPVHRELVITWSLYKFDHDYTCTCTSYSVIYKLFCDCTSYLVINVLIIHVILLSIHGSLFGISQGKWNIFYPFI